MGRYVVRRLLQFVPTFVGATFLLHALVFALPGDPIRALAGEKPLPPAVHRELTDRYHLDEPLVVQYGHYLGGLVTGDLGRDFSGRPVTDIMTQRLPITVRLGAITFVVQTVIGVVAGVLAALRRDGFLDQLVRVATIVAIAIPVFVLGFAFQLIVGVELGWLPVAGVGDGWISYVLPATVLAATSLAFIARLTRTALVEELREGHVRTAVAKGLTRGRVVGVHALRNSLIPVVTFLGFNLGFLLGGAIITETIFNLPGVGRQVFESIRAQEGAVVVGLVTFLVIVFLVANLVVDLLYAWLDPRIRYD